ncbi:MAG TPA: sulfatase-like hydrolase/transferase, partial [Terriglobales bacterium]
MSNSAAVRAAAWYCALAWATYAILEAAFIVIVPWLLRPVDFYQPLHFGVTGALLLGYPLFGAVLGVALGPGLMAVRRRRGIGSAIDAPHMIAVGAAVTVVLALTLELLSQLPGPRNLAMAAGVGLLLVIALLAGLASGSINRRLEWIANTWTAISLLLGIALLPRYVASSKFMAMGLYAAAILATSYFLGRSAGMIRRLKAAEPYLLTGCAIVVLGCAGAFNGGLYVKSTKKTVSRNRVNRPNVLLIVLDTVRADHTSVFGYHRDTTPNLRKLAEQAVAFDRAVATSDWTLPAHASLFTGLYPSEHGAYSDPSGKLLRLNDARTTLAETLSRAGYRTAAVVANITMLLRHFNVHQGFHYYAVRNPVAALSGAPRAVLRRRVAASVKGLRGQVANPTLYRNAREITTEAMAVLEDLKESG